MASENDKDVDDTNMWKFKHEIMLRDKMQETIYFMHPGYKQGNMVSVWTDRIQN